MATELAQAYVQIIPSVKDIKSNITSELSGITDAANEAESSINLVGDAAGNAGHDFDALGSDAGAAGSDLNSLGSDADSAGSDLDSLGADADSAGGDLDALGSDAGSAGSDLNSLGSDAESAAGSLFELGDAAGDAVGEIGDLGSELGGALTSGSSSASDAFGAVNDVMDAFATGGISAGVAAGITAIVDGLKDLIEQAEVSQGILAQSTGATGEDLEELQEIAKTAFKEVKLASQTDLNEVSNVVGELSTRFRDLGGEDLKDATVSMTDFATITGQDAVSAVDSVADTISKWHLEADDMPEVLDLITAASQESKISASELESSLSTNAGYFQDLGLSIEDATAFLAAYTEGGGEASELNSLLRNATNNLVGEVDDVPGAFMAALDAIQNTAEEESALTQEIEGTGLTVEDVFGKKTDIIASALNGSMYSLEDMQDALSDTSGRMQQTADDSITTSDRMASSWNTVKVGASDMAVMVDNSFNDMYQSALGVGEGMASGLESGTAEVTSAATGLADSVIQAVNGTLEVNSPSRVMIESGEDVTEGLAQGMEGMPDAISGTLDETVGAIKTFGSDANSAMQSASSGVLSSVDASYGQVPSHVSNPLNSALSNIGSWGGNVESNVSSSATSTVNALKSSYSQVPNTVQSPLTSALSDITKWGSQTQTSGSNIGRNFVTAVSNGLQNLANKVQTSLTSALNNVTKWGTSLGTDATSIATTFVSNFQNGLSNLASTVNSALSSANSTVSSWSGTMTSSGTTLGQNIVQGMINGINNKSGALNSTITSVVNSAISAANAAAATGSPSKKMIWTGEMMGEGLAIGIENEVGTVDSAMDRLMEATDRDPAMASYSASAYGNASAGNIINITQNIYSQAQTAAALMREARNQARRAVIQGV